MGEFCVRFSALCESHESITLGSQVSPFENLMTTGMSVVLTVELGCVWATKGFLPTIVYWNVEAPSCTVAVNIGTDALAAVCALTEETAAAVRVGVQSRRACFTVILPMCAGPARAR